jgi:hypothetical protein
MTERPDDRLFKLLPAVFQARDAALGQPLRALLAIVAEERQLLEDDVAELYDNWFIETCDEWVVPYLGDLLGVPGLPTAPDKSYSLRSFVANTLRYRRAKGTAAVLEQLARDLTGWPARAVEFFDLLATTQFVNHPRPGKGGLVDLSNPDAIDLMETAFSTVAHTADVRRIENDRGRYNISNVGLFLWRIQAYPVERSTPRLLDAGRYHFDPLGRDLPLFNPPRTETDLVALAAEINVPDRLRRRPLAAELRRMRDLKANSGAQAADGLGARFPYFGDPGATGSKGEERTAVFQCWIPNAAGDLAPIAPTSILMCDLSGKNWSLDWKKLATDDVSVVVDPDNGRFRLDPTELPAVVEVSYDYGFGGDLGGGPYPHQQATDEWFDALAQSQSTQPAIWQRGVTGDQTALAKAFADWREAGVANGLIVIMDSRTYDVSSEEIVVPAGGSLAIVAGSWPTEGTRPSASGLRPLIRADLTFRGAEGEHAEAGRLLLDGLLIEGSVTVAEGDLGLLHLAHSTIAKTGDPTGPDDPTKPGAVTAKRNPRLSIRIHRTICVDVELDERVAGLSIVDSIVGAIAASRVPLDVQSSTIFGKVRGETLQAGNSIFAWQGTGAANADEATIDIRYRQTGCVRFCYVPCNAQTPRRYYCQPRSCESPANLALRFVSERLGDAGYGQLASDCAPEIATGAEDGEEMGAFHFLRQRQRLALLRDALDEHLRLGLTAGIILAT